MATLGAPAPGGAGHPGQRDHAIRRRRGLAGRALSHAGLSYTGLVLMVVQVPFFVSIALTAPLAGRIGLWVVWLSIFILGVHWRGRPPRVLLLAGVLACCWSVLGAWVAQ